MRAKERELLRYLKKHCLGQQNALGGEKLMKVFRISGTELRKLIHDHYATRLLCCKMVQK